jgi:hypothetical protein
MYVLGDAVLLSVCGMGHEGICLFLSVRPFGTITASAGWLAGWLVGFWVHGCWPLCACASAAGWCEVKCMWCFMALVVRPVDFFSLTVMKKKRAVGRRLDG